MEAAQSRIEQDLQQQDVAAQQRQAMSQETAPAKRVEPPAPVSKSIQSTLAHSSPPLSQHARVAPTPRHTPKPPEQRQAASSQEKRERRVAQNSVSQRQPTRSASRDNETAEIARKVEINRRDSAQLARQLRAAMAQGNGPVVEKLLTQLRQTRGPDHPFLLKSEAFWAIKQKHYPAAEASLKRILAKTPDDLEAGVNLAIVEMRTKRMEQAKERLSNLQRAYPDNAQVRSMMRYFR
ncbi:tetratricopeptide repeat protein [Magnetofaba australis]|nr:tetratricopeptide repeat protein [Magnetofaba australis]